MDRLQQITNEPLKDSLNGYGKVLYLLCIVIVNVKWVIGGGKTSNLPIDQFIV